MDPDIQRRAQAKAAELGISLAEYVRRLVADDLGAVKRQADVALVFDLGASAGPTDIARDKDRLIGEAVWQNYLRKVGRKPRRARSAKKSGG